jgi:uncharacterized protein (TIGR00255 family)
MLLSMTGFGNIQSTHEDYTIIAEVKSLNSKGLDLAVRMPRQLPAEKEMWVRNWIKEHLERGKISVYLDIIPITQAQTSVQIQEDIVKAYIAKAKKIAQETQTDTQGLLAWALQMPDATQTHNINQNINQNSENEQNSETQLWIFCQNALENALEKCKNFRQIEGNELQKTFELSIQKITEYLAKIEDQDPQRRLQIRQKLEERLGEITRHEYFDKNRFEQEMIFYLEKWDISEEKTRLNQHLQYFTQTLQEKDANGKKLNFISQEIGREINTIGSKANDALIQQWVVVMKEELEKIKEQCLNIL